MPPPQKIMTELCHLACARVFQKTFFTKIALGKRVSQSQGTFVGASNLGLESTPGRMGGPQPLHQGRLRTLDKASRRPQSLSLLPEGAGC